MEKLVKDKIIISKGEIVNYYIADDNEYKIRLNDKLEEEIAELLKTDNERNFREEMADVLEVIEAIADVNHIKMAEIYQIKELKKRERDGFCKKNILKM